MRPLNTAFGRCRVCADAINVELIQRTTKLGVAWAAHGLRSVDSKDARLVAIERERLAVALDVRSGRFEIRECRLRARKVHDHKSAGRIIDVYQCRASRRPTLKPTMLAAVDLHEFAQASSPRTRLMHLRRSKLARNPQTRGNLQLPNRLFGDHDVVPTTQLLSRQRRAKVRVLLTQDPNDALSNRGLQRPVAGPITMPRDQAHRTFSSIADHQAFDLPHAHPQALGSPSRLQFPVDHRLDRLQPIKVSHVSCYPRIAHRQAPKSLTDLRKLGPSAQKHDICI